MINHQKRLPAIPHGSDTKIYDSSPNSWEISLEFWEEVRLFLESGRKKLIKTITLPLLRLILTLMKVGKPYIWMERLKKGASGGVDNDPVTGKI